MVTYEQLKIWFETHKQKFVLAACFVLVFLAGIGVGRYEKANRQANKNITNYSTNSAKPQVKNLEAGDTAVLGTVVAKEASTTPVGTGECKIKGNIGTSGKIFHIPGGASYKIVKPEMCFNTEAEALAAGFRKSGR